MTPENFILWTAAIAVSLLIMAFTLGWIAIGVELGIFDLFIRLFSKLPFNKEKRHDYYRIHK